MTERVNKSDFLKEVAKQTGHTQKDVKEVYEGIIDVLIKELDEGKDVSLSQFGKFYKRFQPERVVVLNGKENIAKARNVLKFSASPKANERLN